MLLFHYLLLLRGIKYVDIPREIYRYDVRVYTIIIMLYVLLQVLYTTIKNNLINTNSSSSDAYKYCMRTYLYYTIAIVPFRIRSGML